MNTKALPFWGLTLAQALAFTTSATAQGVRVFGPPRPGHARPPLWINVGHSSHGGGGGGGTSLATPPYTPQQIQTAYGFSALYTNSIPITGSGQTIAIVDAYGSPTLNSDLAAFTNQFKLPAANLTVVNYPAGSTPPANSGWAQETSLDVEWAHAIAPGANILLVVAADSSFANLMGAVQLAATTPGVSAVSMSWGGQESGSIEATYDSYFATPGVTFVASAGDSGEIGGSVQVEWPAASPNVIAVGGTTLQLASSGAWHAETAWSSGGGGISDFEAQPSWQNGWFQPAWSPLDRGVPDVAYLANPNYGVYVAYNGAWYEFGGTSVGAPQWAALVALSNSSRTDGNTLGRLAPPGAAVYSTANLGTKTTYGGYASNTTYFHDITQGQNGHDSDDKCYAGYDLVTGVGSPRANNLVPALSTK
ncbi:MAG: S53 family peptidase [Verrucomicrobia bacterium]|nr:S53 family peptidase [Verrucomicrobiota bacterium]